LGVRLFFLPDIRQDQRLSRFSHAGKLGENQPVFNSRQVERGRMVQRLRKFLLSVINQVTFGP
jgi:hypothetical protein